MDVAAEAIGTDAYECALRALHHRDRTAFEIDEHLRGRGFSDDERAQAIETLRRTGLVDDERFTHARVASLAERAGDTLIRARLAEAGVAVELVESALEKIAGEVTRARRIVERRGTSAKTARYLHGKGFSYDVVEAVIAEGDGGELG